jgi:methylmalonyl-CoA mutase
VKISDHFSIGDEFEKKGLADWLDAVGQDLKMNEVEQRLNKKTLEGVMIRPLGTKSSSIQLNTFPTLRNKFQSYENSDQLAQHIATDRENGINNFHLKMQQLPQDYSWIQSGDKVWINISDLKQLESLVEVTTSNQVRLLVDPFLFLAEDNLTEVLDQLQAKLSSNVSLLLDATRIHNAGASMVQEIAFIVSWLSKYLNHAKKHQYQSHIILHLSCDSQVFSNVAKLRAVRFLTERMLEEFALDISFEIMASNSLREQTLYDPWVNILRNVTSNFAATLGGADSMDAFAYSELFTRMAKEQKNELASRIARNGLHIMLEESHLATVSDPMQGSYSVEDLTTQLIENGWNLFLQKEREGGFKLDTFAKEVDAIAQARYLEVRKRKKTVTGLNNFANIEDSIKGLYKADKVHDKSSGQFPLRRLGAEFETLRMNYETGAKQISGYVAIFGDPSKLTARANFAKNYFEVLGIPMVESTGSGLSVKEHLQQMKDATLVVLCAQDDEYQKILDDSLSQLEGKKVYLAGKPAEVKLEDYQSKGLQGNIFMGQDVYTVLSQLVEEL